MLIVVEAFANERDAVRYANAFANDRTRGERRIDRLVDEIATRMSSLRRDIACLDQEHDARSRRIGQIRANCQLALSAKLSRLVGRFQSEHRRLLTRTTETCPRPVGAMPGKVLRSPTSDVSWSSPHAASGQLLLLDARFVYDDQLHEDQQASLLRITEATRTILQLHRDMAALVAHQGTLLDRIDVNVEETTRKTGKAAVHIGRRAKREQMGRRRWLVLVLIVLIVLLTMAVLLKPHK